MTRSSLHRRMSLKSHTPLRKRARKRSTRVEDPAYGMWILHQRSIVGIEQISESDMLDVFHTLFPDGGPVGLEVMALVLRGIEKHHHKPSDDHTLVPLLWFLHRETRISVHGGGGRRKFAQRFGIDWDEEIAKLRVRYEVEKGAAA